MTASRLLDHVSAYATAVRSHLSDLPAEQVEDLTDGLEADLAEALQDAAGPSVAEASEGSQLVDLARRFGPAGDYAAELRAAAGLGVAAAQSGRGRRLNGRVHGLRDAVRRIVADGRDRALVVAEPLRSAPAARWLVDLAAAMRPLWWLLRGWVWFVLALGVLSPFEASLDRFVPGTPGAWFLALLAGGLSVAVGRGLGRGVTLVRRGAAVLSVIAVLAAPWALSSFDTEVHWRLSNGSYPVYIETPVVSEVLPEEGVFVDGQQVSNLFVYDAAGNPLSDVQIVDDRGRQVRAVASSTSEWSMPGVAEPWSFVPRTDADGRTHWNVYPLLGAPVSQWWYPNDGGRELLDGSQAQSPPAPFAMAPALSAAATTPGDAPGTAP